MKKACNSREFHFPVLQSLNSIDLLQMSWVITWVGSSFTSKVVEAVRGQKHHILAHTLALLTQRSGHPTAPVLLTKRNNS